MGDIVHEETISIMVSISFHPMSIQNLGRGKPRGPLRKTLDFPG